ncbi:MAG: PQQ-dependent sugar dehydrogenase [Pseudomonas sp.]|nr:PQQ-dependent sugar dehydrogenase [Pseudomonas sp.]
MRLHDLETDETGSIGGVPEVVHDGRGGLGDVLLHPRFEDNQQVPALAMRRSPAESWWRLVHKPCLVLHQQPVRVNPPAMHSRTWGRSGYF